jgi:multisubunit Na+/H+ antiporter MnhF subunit
MNVWLIAAIFFVSCLIPCMIRCMRGTELDRLTGLETGALIEVQIFLLLSEAIHREAFCDLALAFALLSLAGGLVFVHFIERWM